MSRACLDSTTHRPLIPMLALCAGSLMACSGADEPVTSVESAGEEPNSSAETAPVVDVNPAQVDALEKAKSQWQAMGTKDYTLQVKLSCFCARRPADDVRVTVRDGEILLVLGNDGDGTYDVLINPSDYRAWYTVEGMFARIEEKLPTTYNLEAVYDSIHGFPSVLAFDYTMASADEEEFFEIWDFFPHAPVELVRFEKDVDLILDQR